MTPLGPTRDAAQALLGSRRDIGPLGTASRVLVGGLPKREAERSLQKLKSLLENH